MKNRILILTILLAATSTFLTFQSCNSGAVANIKGSLIEGTIANAGGLQLFLDHINYNNSNDVISRVEIDNEGNFEVPLEEGLENGIYRIRIGVKKAFFVFDGTEKVVSIEGDLASFDSYNFKIDGSSASKEFCTLMQKKSSSFASLVSPI